MMTITAPQMKAYLEEIKNEFLDDTITATATTNNTTKSLDDYIHCLCCMEMLQRGVMIPTTTTIQDSSPMLDMICHVAGKPLLDHENDTTCSSKIPKPLLAGSAIIAGRIAERMARLDRLDTGKNTIRWTKPKIDQAVQRCKEVQDKRLQGLLQIIQYSVTSEMDPKRIQFLFVLAEGYYYRAAQFQPDAPPMWKRIWEVVVERYQTQTSSSILQKKDSILHNPESTWEIVVPLQQLIRIASSKGNETRVHELQILLAESILDVSDPPECNDTLGVFLREQFISPYRSIQPFSRYDVSHIASNALEHLTTTVTGNNIAEHMLLVLLLNLRFQMNQEENEISEMAELLHTKAKNRGDKILSLDKYYSMAQHQVLANMVTNDLVLIMGCKVRDVICDHVLFHQTPMDDGIHYRFRQACQIITDKFCDRLIIRAKAVALSMKNSVELMSRAWKEVHSFIEPIISAVQNHVQWNHTLKRKDRMEALQQFLDSSMTVEYKSMLEKVVCICPLAEWMLQGMISEEQVDSDILLDRIMLVLVHDLLILLHSQVSQLDQTKQDNSVVSSAMGVNQRRLKRLEVNLACCVNFLAMSGNYLDESSRSLVDQAITRLNRLSDDDTSIEVDGSGLFCLDFFICWWGLQRMPWTFCTLPESRLLLKRARWAFDVLHKKWGRPTTLLEKCLLDLGEADGESTYFSGGFAVIAKSGYQRVLSLAEQLPNETVKQLLIAESQAGLASVRFMQSSRLMSENTERVEGFVQDALQLSMNLRKGGTTRKLYLWTDENTVRASLEFHIAALRQFLASILVNKGDESSAEKLLEEAVQDSPTDANAASALGSYRLRMMLFGNETSPADTKAAHVQLMKAARLDSTRAEPFALLGYWYERTGDKQRAVGCYSKAVLLEPSQPVAGRGLLRLAKAETMSVSITQAINSGSPLSGWAWRVTATQKAQNEGRDDLAILAYLNCLRCTDIDRPQQEAHGMFYSDPTKPRHASSDEKSVILGELATCYRRQGRFTAAIRTFHAAIKAGGENVLSSIFCGCGQAELELGLYDEAIANFQKAAQVAQSYELPWTMYGQAVTFLALAQRDFHQQKIGSSFQRLQQGIMACDTPFQQLSTAFNKLLGDIYTFGAFLPSDVFVDCRDASMTELESKLAFVEKGERAYSLAIQAHIDWEGEDKIALQSSLVYDLAVNKLLRAQICTNTGYTTEAKKLFEEASDGFRRAIDIHPQYPAAWCGLGSAVFKSDPLLAQHAFCRSVNLDGQFQDALANLSFLYTENNAFSQSAIISDALTQIADTPMMWINRALILEREVAADPSTRKAELQISQAADAYMAALQVERHPTAILGAAVTKRTFASDELKKNVVKLLDSLSLLTEYSRGRRLDDAWASLLHQLSLLEVERIRHEEKEPSSLDQISQQIQASIDKLKRNEAFPEDFVYAVESFIRQPPKTEKNKVGYSLDQTKLSAARKLVHDPANGEMWLSLAKELVSKIQGEHDVANHQAALTASSRALYILRGQLARSHTCPPSPSHVHAEDISDALVLNYWLKHDTNTVPVSETSSQQSHEALQMSLLMFPNNLLAREALKSQSTT